MSYKRPNSAMSGPPRDRRARKKTLTGVQDRQTWDSESSPASDTPPSRNVPAQASIPQQSNYRSPSVVSNISSPSLTLPLLMRGIPAPWPSATQPKSNSATNSGVSSRFEDRMNVSISGDDHAESEMEVQAREDADALNEIIMAIEYKSQGSIGCAYYIAAEEKLYMMQDVKFGGLDIIEALKLRARPTDILISTRAEESLENSLRSTATNRNNFDVNERKLKGLDISYVY